MRCVAVLGNRGSDAFGVIYAEEGEQNGKTGVHFFGAIRGLKPGALHGFHVHEAGDLSRGCASACAHFDPDGSKRHGGPDSADGKRHAGDLGNVRADDKGVAEVCAFGKGLALNGGPRSVLGRSLVVHENRDDLGRYRGKDAKRKEESRETGRAGARLMCGVLGIAAAKQKRC